MFSKRFLQRFVSRPTHPCFSPLQVLLLSLHVNGDFLANLGVEDYLRWYNSHPILLYCTYALTSRVKWVHSRSPRTLLLGQFYV